MSESDVYRRQILTTKVDPRAVGVNRCYWTLLNRKQYFRGAALFHIMMQVYFYRRPTWMSC